MFDFANYNVTLREDVTIGTRVVTVHASDSDLGDAGRVTYSIVSGDGIDRFSIDASSGVLSVIAGLDYETKTSYAYV